MEKEITGFAPEVVFHLATQIDAFVGDIVAANLAAAHVGALPHDIYNVGTGTEVDLLQLVDAVGAVAGLPAGAFAPEFHPARAGEVRRSCLDVTRARTDLGLGDPTPLVDGLRATLDWVRTL